MNYYMTLEILFFGFTIIFKNNLTCNFFFMYFFLQLKQINTKNFFRFRLFLFRLKEALF